MPTPTPVSPCGAQGVQRDVGGADPHLQAHLCPDHVVSEPRVCAWARGTWAPPWARGTWASPRLRGIWAWGTWAPPWLWGTWAPPWARDMGTAMVMEDVGATMGTEDVGTIMGMGEAGTTVGTRDGGPTMATGDASTAVGTGDAGTIAGRVEAGTTMGATGTYGHHHGHPGTVTRTGAVGRVWPRPTQLHPWAVRTRERGGSTHILGGRGEPNRWVRRHRGALAAGRRRGPVPERRAVPGRCGGGRWRVAGPCCRSCTAPARRRPAAGTSPGVRRWPGPAATRRRSPRSRAASTSGWQWPTSSPCALPRPRPSGMPRLLLPRPDSLLANQHCCWAWGEGRRLRVGRGEWGLR